MEATVEADLNEECEPGALEEHKEMECSDADAEKCEISSSRFAHWQL